jgi:hypothetical protein
MSFNPEATLLGPVYGVEYFKRDIFELSRSELLVRRAIKLKHNRLCSLTAEEAATRVKSDLDLLESSGVNLPQRSFIYEKFEPFWEDGNPRVVMLLEKILGHELSSSCFLIRQDPELPFSMEVLARQILNLDQALLRYMLHVLRNKLPLMYDVFSIRQYMFGYTNSDPQSKLYLADIEDRTLLPEDKSYYEDLSHGWVSILFHLELIMINRASQKQKLLTDAQRQAFLELATEAKDLIIAEHAKHPSFDRLLFVPGQLDLMEFRLAHI